jgi:hypothetical protein
MTSARTQIVSTRDGKRLPRTGTMTRLIFGPARLETTGANATYYLDPLPGYGDTKDVLYMAKVHKVKTTGTTVVQVAVSHSPDGDASMTESHSTPITGAVASEPIIRDGYTDTDTNGPIGEWLHPSITIGGGAGEWAVVELYETKKPT